MVLAVPACAGPAGTGRIVFTVQSKLLTEGGHFPTGTIVDVGLTRIHNVTGSSVRIRSIKPVNLPRGVRVFRIYAYTYKESSDRIAITIGNLIRDCPRTPPYPLRRVVTAPHADSRWQVMVAFKVVKPGRYTLNRVRINYTQNGRKGWQYQNFGMIFINHKLKPGEHPLPTQCP